MFSTRLKQLRLARGLSQEALAAEMGGIVTKQAISKYERRSATPSPVVMAQLARVLGVKSSSLWGESTCRVEFVAYRKSSGLGRRDQARVENVVRQALDERVRLHERVYGAHDELDFPVQYFDVHSLNDAEQAAEAMRLSARGYTRMLRVARPIADLAGAAQVGRGRLGERARRDPDEDEARKGDDEDTCSHLRRPPRTMAPGEVSHRAVFFP